MYSCKLHPKLQILWVCVERDCSQRVMCSTCAVKFHDRTHSLEAVNLLNQGCLATFLSNPKNQSSALKYIQEGPKPLEFENIQYEDHIQVSIERSLRSVQKKIENAKQEFLNQYEQLSAEQEIQRQETLQYLSKLDEKISNNPDHTQEAFEFLKQYEFNPSKETSTLKRKLDLLNLMRDNFMRMIKSYFHNQFIAEFCHLFEMQIESLTPQVDDVDQFLNYMEEKWRQDYRNIQLSIEKFTLRLSEGLKYSLALPLERRTHQLPEIPLRKNVKIEPVSQQHY